MTAKVLFEKTRNNTVSVKVNLGEDKNNGFTYRVGMKRGIRLNKGEDRKEYPFIVTYRVLDDFLSLNGVKEKEVVIDPNSIDTFYGYDDYAGTFHVFVNPTPSKVNEWWNYDCPDLYRYMVNKNNSTNMLGMRILCFSHKLVESSWSFTYIGEDITEEEVSKLTKGYEHTSIYREMMATLQSRKLKSNEVQEMIDYIDEYEEKLQKLIDSNKYDIMEHAIEELFNIVLVSDRITDRIKQILNNLSVSLSKGNSTGEVDMQLLKDEFIKELSKDKDSNYQEVLRALDGCFGLDCGWVNIYTQDSTYKEYKKLLKNLSNVDYKYRSHDTNLKVPFNCQSTTVQKHQFYKIKEIAKKELGESLYSQVQLD